jgi:hypothetical protein
MRRKKKNKTIRSFKSASIAPQVREETPSARECPWVVTVKLGTTTFRSLYGIARHYAGCSDVWSEVQPGEFKFHFAVHNVAISFVRYCLKKNLEFTFFNENKPEEVQNLESLRGMPMPARDGSLMLKTIPEMRTYPMRLELAGHYADDAADFLHRYRVIFYSEEVDFQGVKSRRTKAYVDLRMALEALLKAVRCLRAPYSLAGKPLVETIRKYSHNIDRLKVDAFKDIRLSSFYSDAISKCSIAPVDLRYKFDAMNFRYPNDRDYYDTIGSGLWLKTIEVFVATGLKRLRAALGRRSKIVPGNVAIQELSRQSDYPSG